MTVIDAVVAACRVVAADRGLPEDQLLSRFDLGFLLQVLSMSKADGNASIAAKINGV